MYDKSVKILKSLLRMQMVSQSFALSYVNEMVKLKENYEVK